METTCSILQKIPEVVRYQHLAEQFAAYLQTYTGDLKKKKPVELYEPEHYILNLGGKRLRPLLVLVGHELFHAHPVNSLPAAMAVELFHNFSLIHDDILDAAPLRRGQPTVHHKWNTNIAILSGDVMLVKSLQVLQKYDSVIQPVLLSLFSQTAIEVCEGQQEDMNFETRENVSVSEYIDMIRKKTAVLLGCSLQMGAVVAGASTRDQTKLFEFGSSLGIAFQLMDDLLDAFPGEGKFGKQTGGDILANKKTFLILSALDSCSDEEKKEINDLLQSNKPDKVKRMLHLFTSLGVPDKCRQAISEYTDRAIASLDKINGDRQKIQDLKEFAVQLMERES